MKNLLLFAGIGVSCFVTGFLVCFIWMQSRPEADSPGAGMESPPAGATAAGAGGGGGGNQNARVAKFETLDLDKDGLLSLAEFTAGRKPAEAEKWFKLRDVNQDGFIGREEFMPFSAPKTQ